MIINRNAAIILIVLTAALLGQCACAQEYKTGPWSSGLGESIEMAATSQMAEQVMDPPEFRALWADTWYGPSFFTPADTALMVDTLYENNFNAVIAEIRKCGDAYYNSAYEPWATNIAGGYDPLADLIDKAHAKGIEVHGWIVTYRIWNRNWASSLPDNHIWKKHPEWAMTNATGGILDGSYYNLDPGVPGTQQYIVDLMKDVISKYDIDGFNFDYIRYPGTAWGYNSLTKDRFYEEYGYYPPTSTSDPNWGTWCDYRRRQVTDLVRKCYVEAVHLNPLIKINVDSIGWMSTNPDRTPRDPAPDFTITRAYTDVFQDHKGWMEEGIVDMNVLMNYKREFADDPYYYEGSTWRGDQKADFRLWTDFLASLSQSTGRHAINGPGIYMNTVRHAVDQMAYTREAGCDGVSGYSYRVTNKDGRPASEFYALLKSELFQNPAPIPDMPWKSNPTYGYLFGQITDLLEPNHRIYQNWLYKVSVSITGPENRTVESDATGTYVFMKLPPGTYNISINHPGYLSAEGTAVVEAGKATKLDFGLAPVLSDDDFLSIEEAKNSSHPDGKVVGLNGNVVTVATGDFPGHYYIQDPDRNWGIKVKPGGLAPAVALGDRVDLVGLLATEEGERYVLNAGVRTKTAGAQAGALRMSVKDTGQTPSADALLVQIAGRITGLGIGWFTVDDASGSIRVVAPGMSVPTAGLGVRVTGICRMEDGVRVIRVRKQSDIQPAAHQSITSPQGALTQGFNLFSLPYTTLDYTPSALFGGLPVANILYRWNSAIQDFVLFDGNPAGPFGRMNQGTGYAYLAPMSGQITFNGFASNTNDVRISLPKEGWSLIGHPFATPIKWYDMKLTNGSETIGLLDAVAEGWIGRIAFTWDPVSGGFGYVGTGARGSRFDDSLRPWKAYWVSTNQDDLALIVPAPGE